MSLSGVRSSRATKARIALTLLSTESRYKSNSPSELVNIGKLYPNYRWFRTRLHNAYASQAHLTAEEDIREALGRASFVRKGKRLPRTSLVLEAHHPMERLKLCR